MLFVFLLALFAQTAGAQGGAGDAAEARTRAFGTGTITGRVVGEDGRPAPNVAVTLFNPFMRAIGPPQTTLTDAEGKFQFANLAPALYIANAASPGFVNAPTPNAGTENEAAFNRVGDFIELRLVKGGVITGTVRDANNEPVVAVMVRAMLVRDAQGKVPRVYGYGRPAMTDDRGVYRLYGLQPGTYVVSAGGSLGFYGMFNAYDGDSPTFYPSSTRDTAAEVPVRAGDEAANIDIRYRGERGHTISGTIAGLQDMGATAGIAVLLRTAATGSVESTTFIQQTGDKQGFSFNGIADGEYDLTAQQAGLTGESLASLPRRVTVKGADVTGLELTLAPLASVEGRVTLDPAPKRENCADPGGGTLPETLIGARRAEKIEPKDTFNFFFAGSAGVPNEQGDFTLRNLRGGSYRLTARLPSDAWYVRSITLPTGAAQTSAAPKQAQGASLSSVLTLRAGEHATGVSVQVAQDGAVLRGRVVSSTEGEALPANLKVYLVPAERERAEDLLRYGETSAASDGTFSFTHLAPGRYLLLSRVMPETDAPERDTRPLAWDTDARAKLRHEAEAANVSVELQPCQRALDYALRYGPQQVMTKP